MDPNAAGLRRRRPRAGDKWHLDEVFIKIDGVRHYLWWAVDQDGNVLDILVQSKRDAKAAKRFLAKLVKKQRRVPRVLVTDKLRSYGVAHRELMRSVEHRSHKGLNNRAENSHQPTRQRERAMKCFRSRRAAQKFLAAFSQISPHFRPRRHLMAVSECRAGMTTRFTVWNQVTGTAGLPAAAWPSGLPPAPPRPRHPRPEQVDSAIRQLDRRSAATHETPGSSSRPSARASFMTCRWTVTSRFADCGVPCSECPAGLSLVG